MRAPALAVVAITAATPAYADFVPHKARKLADRGRAAHDARDYAAAIAAFTEAYALAPAPGLLFNLAQAYRLRGNCEDASLMYRRFLATAPADDARGLADQHLATVERCVRKLDVAANAKMVALRLPRAPIERRPIAVRRLDDKPGRRPAETTGIGLALAGGAALVVAGWYALDANDTATEVERRYANGEKWSRLEALDAEGDRAAHVAKVSLGVGMAAVLAGATVLVIDHRRSKRSLKVEPVSRGAKIGVSWQF